MKTYSSQGVSALAGLVATDAELQGIEHHLDLVDRRKITTALIDDQAHARRQRAQPRVRQC